MLDVRTEKYRPFKIQKKENSASKGAKKYVKTKGNVSKRLKEMERMDTKSRCAKLTGEEVAVNGDGLPTTPRLLHPR